MPRTILMVGDGDIGRNEEEDTEKVVRAAVTVTRKEDKERKRIRKREHAFRRVTERRPWLRFVTKSLRSALDLYDM